MKTRKLALSQTLKAFAACAAAAFTLTASISASAETCHYISTGDQGDDYYIWGNAGWNCQQNFIDYWWDAFEFEKDYWDDGMGYAEPCNNAQPLARMFNALYALGYSSTNTPSCSTSGDDVTKWAMCWAADNIKRTWAKCGNGGTSGTLATTFRPTVGTKRTEFYWPFFYGQSVVRRASTVFHEARHASSCGHNAKDSDCDRGESCDKSWSDGCKDLGKQAGANRYQVSFLAWYIASAWRATSGLKDDARSRANDVLNRGFKSDPCFRISSSGGSYSVC